MNVSLSSLFIILLAALSANLPFLSERVFALVPLAKPTKSLWLRLLELLFLYFVVRGIAYLLEARAGNVFPQHWEFYAITICLFLVLAFPGFVFRYLRKHHG
jgi:hypothetical protein